MSIAVIVPFWNAEQWLDRCCASLSDQDGKFVFVLVDDHSTDESFLKACEWCNKDDRFVLLTNQRTKGVSGARNTGLDYVGDRINWVTFLDADDEMLPDAYNTFRKVIQADMRANIHQLNHMRYYTRINKLVNKYSNEGGVYRFGKMPVCWFYVWNKLIRASWLGDIRFQEGLQYGEDGLFTLDCMFKDNYVHCGDWRLTTTKHRFDNMESLSRVKRPEDLRQQIDAYVARFDQQTDKTILIELAATIASLWNDAMISRLKAL